MALRASLRKVGFPVMNLELESRVCLLFYVSPAYREICVDVLIDDEVDLPKLPSKSRHCRI